MLKKRTSAWDVFTVKAVMEKHIILPLAHWYILWLLGTDIYLLILKRGRKSLGNGNREWVFFRIRLHLPLKKFNQITLDQIQNGEK